MPFIAEPALALVPYARHSPAAEPASGLPDRFHQESPELQEARYRLFQERARFAGAIANRHTHLIFNSGSELKKDIRRSNPAKNPQYRYIQALDRVIDLAGERYETEEQKRAAALREKLGEEGRDEAGELFKLNQAVYEQRMLKGGFHDILGSGHAGPKLTGNPALKNWRAVRRYAYDKWYSWSEKEGWRGKAKKIGALAVLGAGTSLATAGLAGVGIAGSGAAVFIARATRNFGIAHVERRAAVHRAGADREDTADRLRAMRRGSEQALEAGEPVLLQTVDHILNKEFTEPARKQSRKNKLQPLLGFAAVAGAGEVARLVRDYMSVVNEGPVHLLAPKAGQPPSRPGFRSALKPSRPRHSTLPAKPSDGIRPGSRRIFVSSKSVCHQFVTTIYQRAEGIRGFTDYLKAEHAAIIHGLLARVQPDQDNPNIWWDVVIKKGARLFAEGAGGSSKTVDVMRVLSHFGRLSLSGR